MKIRKGNKTYPVITGNDVIVTKGTQSLKTVDDALNDQQKEIDSLKSNVKYIYSYGGVGGTGTGSSSGSGGSSTSEPSLYIALAGHQLSNGGSTIVLGDTGTYKVEANIRNSNGNIYFLKVSCGTDIEYAQVNQLSSSNKWKFSESFSLTSNGEITVQFFDSDLNTISTIIQKYIVKSHTFETKFMYQFNNGQNEAEFSSSNEYFIGDVDKTNPFIDTYFKIDIPDVTNVSLTYSVGDTDSSDTEENNGQGIKSYGSTTDISNDHFRIYLDNLTRNGVKFTDDANTGVYTVSITLKYYASGEEVESQSEFEITLIPVSLYINVRNPQGILYDSLSDLLDAMDNGEGGIPEKYVVTGSYVSFYCKVYEGSMTTNTQTYDLTFKAYDEISDSTDYAFDSDASISDTLTGVTEQVETPKPISVPFSTPGIKMVVISTYTKKSSVAELKYFTKYLYVKESDSTIDWYPSLTMNNYYFRANQSSSYSSGFPTLSSGTQPLELSVSGSAVTLADSVWRSSSTESLEATIFSLGIQYSAVNEDSAKILDIYAPLGTDDYSNTPEITLYSDQLFSDTSDQKKIRIPYEDSYDKTDISKYHLIQIVRQKIGYINTSTPQYASYLYVDGILESNKPTLDTYALYIGKIVLNNVNVAYNLIEIDNIKPSKETINMDGFIYQYNLKYQESMKNSTISDVDKVMLENIDNIKFDGTNVVFSDTGVISTIAPYMPIPTMMASYTTNDVSKFESALFQGYSNGDTGSFGTRDIDLYWCSAMNGNTKSTFGQISVPQYGSLSGNWQIELQGTSTMRNRIKNFSLILNTTSSSADETESLLVSPNYDANDPYTFLPEKSWTIKADIADSAHANNTAIGKFVNRTCTKYDTGQSLSATNSKYIKNTLEGFPIMMYFQIIDSNDSTNSRVYYLGVYNFNLGRSSYYNLGYNTAEDTTKMINNIVDTPNTAPFVFSKGSSEMVDTLAIGEIQDNFAQFDFHQYDESVLFQSDSSTITKMFGKDSKITGIGEKNAAKKTLLNFVKSVAKAGAYCFANIGKDAVSSQAGSVEGETSGTDCVDRYTEVNQVPDVAHQFKYEGNTMVWYDQNEITFDGVKGNVDNLLQCINDTLVIADTTNEPCLDYTSAAEYYTICMAFGLVDSVLKNMNIKSWDGTKCYIAFYDMDCANGENNAGGEDVSYLAATDYWHSDYSKGYVEPVTVDWDYWKDSVGKGFDFKSSYLFAIVKYAQSLLNSIDDTKNIKLTHYPQEFWAALRNPDTGELKSADYFLENYFVSGIGQIPSYMSSLNYQVKYLYKGSILDDNGNPTDDKFLANSSAFNGSRIEKVREWLTRRFHFLDAMFNVQGVELKIYSNITMPIPSNLSALSSNSDVTMLTDAFSTDTNSRVLSGNNALAVNIYAPLNTPFVINRGSSYDMYLLCAGTGVANPVQITTQRDVATRFYGSKSFTNLSMAEPFFTSANQIVSNNIEEINYGGTTMPTKDLEFDIVSTSVKVIKMNIPTFSGTLVIDNSDLNGQAVHTLNVSNSGFKGDWTGLKNLQHLNISSVVNKTGTINISDCPKLKGEYCTISGRNSDNPTTLNKLSMSGVSGKFTLNNTAIQIIDMTSLPDEESSFEIDGDSSLTTLSIQGFTNVTIKNCPKLKNLSIVDTEFNKCKTIIINTPLSYNDREQEDYAPVLTSFNSSTSGIFDFTSYTALETLGVTGCYGVRLIKIPNHKVKVTSFQNNIDLEFIDTTGIDSVISLTQGYTFYMCPKYSMRQSWAYRSTGEIWNEKLIKDTKDNEVPYTYLTYTKMCVDSSCETLVNTFNKTYQISSDYLKSSNNSYENEWGQKVYNSSIQMSDAVWFINNVVHGSPLDDTHLIYISKENGDEIININDQQEGGTILYGEDCCENITSLSGCFSYQTGIYYNGNPNVAVPDLSHYRSLTNVSNMYYTTNIQFLNAKLLSLPSDMNTNDYPIVDWSQFVKNGDINISEDALENVSYRTANISSLTFSVYGNDTDYTNLLTDVDIVDLLHPIVLSDDGNDVEYVPFNRLTAFNSFSVNSSQNVDYTKLFEVCPNVTTLGGFLNCDLSNANISGMLKNCTKLTYVNDSFNHTGTDVKNLPEVDLYDFFNWGENTAMTCLFSSGASEVPSFALNKTISFEHFKEVMSALSKYTNITALSSIFSYCTITDYDTNYEIVLDDDMTKITSINSLFYMCDAKGTDGLEAPLKIRRSFFKHLPNVVSMANTFNSVIFDHMFSFDFFCKRKRYSTNTNIYVYDTDTSKYMPATLETYMYGSSSEKITNMLNCFKNAKFKCLESWFNMNDEINTSLYPEMDKVTYNGKEYDAYYKISGTNYVKYDIAESEVITDNINNFTNYVDIITISKNNKYINNHNILADMQAYGNEGDIFDSAKIAKFNLSPTYCCLPPDILYACSDDCKLTDVFANTNIIGVIPKHLVSKCYNGTFEDMLLNTNILPNVFYHYNKKTATDSDYLEMIKDIPVDNDTIMTTSSATDPEYTFKYAFSDESDKDNASVLFRDDSGTLKRRCPRNGDDRSDDSDEMTNAEYSKSQFVYVPQGFTTNTNLYAAFTFRYNLPDQVDLVNSTLLNEGITWPNGAGKYDIEYSPEGRDEHHKPYLWPFYTQYFFLADDSIDWSRVRIMRYPFISDSKDVDYKNGISRKFYDSTSEGESNCWWQRGDSVGRGFWHTQTNGLLNTFLNLCGERDTRTGELTDCGCLISKAMNNYPKIDNFVNGSLVILLNGRVLDDQIDGGGLTSNNVIGGKIIVFNGYGRNIRLPYFNSYIEGVSGTVLLECNSLSSRFYTFMFPSDTSKSNYMNIYIGANSEGSNDDNLIYTGTAGTDTETTKYIVI